MPQGQRKRAMAAHGVAHDAGATAIDRQLRGLGGRRHRHRDGRWYWHWDPAFLANASDQAVQRDPLIDPASLGAAASGLRLPTLLVRGGESDVLSIEDSARFLEVVPHAEFASVAGAHHMVAGDDNDAFTATVLDYLDVLPAADAAASSATNEHVTGARS